MKFFLKTSLLMLLAISVTGCAFNRKEDLKRYRKMCREYGFKEGTPAFSRCLQDADLNDHGVILRQFTNY